MILLFLVAAGYALYTLKPIPICTDGRQNGVEEGIDCGGSCPTSCLEPDPRDLVQLWARFFPTHSNMYDVAALVENVNIRTSARSVHYVFKLYSSSRVLLARREGVTYLYPNEKTVVYEPNISVGIQRPTYVDFTIDDFQWQPFEDKNPLKIEISEKRYESDPHPTLHAVLTNRAVFEEGALEVFGLLGRIDGTVYAASRTTIENLPGGSQKEVIFTWPNTPLEAPGISTVLFRRLER